jgi:hypothetical protein
VGDEPRVLTLSAAASNSGEGVKSASDMAGGLVGGEIMMQLRVGEELWRWMKGKAGEDDAPADSI